MRFLVSIGLLPASLKDVFDVNEVFKKAVNNLVNTEPDNSDPNYKGNPPDSLKWYARYYVFENKGALGANGNQTGDLKPKIVWKYKANRIQRNRPLKSYDIAIQGGFQTAYLAELHKISDPTRYTKKIEKIFNKIEHNKIVQSTDMVKLQKIWDAVKDESKPKPPQTQKKTSKTEVDDHGGSAAQPSAGADFVPPPPPPPQLTVPPGVNGAGPLYRVEDEIVKHGTGLLKDLADFIERIMWLFAGKKPNVGLQVMPEHSVALAMENFVEVIRGQLVEHRNLLLKYPSDDVLGQPWVQEFSNALDCLECLEHNLITEGQDHYLNNQKLLMQLQPAIRELQKHGKPHYADGACSTAAPAESPQIVLENRLMQLQFSWWIQDFLSLKQKIVEGELQGILLSLDRQSGVSEDDPDQISKLDQIIERLTPDQKRLVTDLAQMWRERPPIKDPDFKMFDVTMAKWISKLEEGHIAWAEGHEAPLLLLAKQIGAQKTS